MADTTATTTSSFGWDDIQETLFGLGGLAVSYQTAKTATNTNTTTSQDDVSDLQPTPQQQQAEQQRYTMLGIDFSQPKNIIATVVVIILSFVLIKKV